MLNKSDNPALFKVLKREIGKLSSDFMHIPLSLDNFKLNVNPRENTSDDILTDKQLAQIESVTINRDDDVQKLDGIENCVNLKKFSQLGLSTRIRVNFDLTKSDYMKNQVIDLSPLYRCKNLENIDLSYQRSMVAINFEYWHKLKGVTLIDCSNLKYVFGIDKLLKNCNLENKIEFNFGNCYALDNISFFEEILQLIDEKKLTQNEIQIILPTFTYFKLSTQKEFKNITQLLKKIENKENSKKVILWSENYHDSSARVYHLSSQMELENRYLNEIIDNLFEKYNPILKLEKMALVYDWIIKNVNYDDEGLAEEEDFKNSQLATSRVVKINYKAVSSSMRSSFVALWEKRVVCVGYANLLTAFYCKLGIDARPIDVAYNAEYLTRRGYGNHVITQINTQQGVYYCDATSKSVNCFMLTAEEFFERKYYFPLYVDINKNIPKLNEEIKNCINNINGRGNVTRIERIFRRAILKTSRRIMSIFNCEAINDYAVLSTEEKENAINMAKQMREERLRIE